MDNQGSPFDSGVTRQLKRAVHIEGAVHQHISVYCASRHASSILEIPGTQCEYLSCDAANPCGVVLVWIVAGGRHVEPGQRGGLCVPLHVIVTSTRERIRDSVRRVKARRYNGTCSRFHARL